MRLRATPWWARRLPEVPLAFAACPTAGCRDTVLSPFDLYCSGPTSHFVVLGTNRRMQVACVYAARGVLGLLVLSAAAWATPFPLYAIALLAGLLLLVLPLRHFVTSQIVAPIIWTAALAFVVATREHWIGRDAQHAIVGAAIAIVLLGLLGTVLVDDDERMKDPAIRPLVLACAVTAASVLAIVGLALTGIGPLEGLAGKALRILPLAGLGGALGGAALTGVVRGTRRVRYHRPLSARSPLTPPTLRMPAGGGPRRLPPRNAGERMAAAVEAAALRLAGGLVGAVELLLRLLYAFVNAVFAAVRRTIHSVRVGSVWLVLAVGAAARAAAETLVVALVLVLEALQRWATGSLLALAAVAAAAEAAAVASDWFSEYLDGAAVTKGPGSLVLALAALVPLVLVWLALTHWPWREVAGAAGRLLEVGGPNTFLVLVVLGWIDGLAGIFEGGPLHPGWLTGAGTVIIVACWLWLRTASEPA